MSSEIMQAVCSEEALLPSSCTLGSVSACLKRAPFRRGHFRPLPVEALGQLAVACGL